MTDAQIADYFKSTIGNTCGRFNTTQLNRTIPLNYKQRLFRPFKYIAAWLMALEVISFKAKAGDVVDTATYTLPVDTLSTSVEDTTICEDPVGVQWVEGKDTLPVTQFLVGDVIELRVTVVNGFTSVALGFCTTTPEAVQVSEKSETNNWFNRFHVDFISNRLVSHTKGQNLKAQSDTSGPVEKGGEGVLKHVRAAVLIRRLKALFISRKRT